MGRGTKSHVFYTVEAVGRRSHVMSPLEDQRHLKAHFSGEALGTTALGGRHCAMMSANMALRRRVLCSTTAVA